MNDRILPTTTNLLGAMEAHVATIAPDTSGALEKATVLHDLAATETDALSSAFTQAFADWKDDLLSDAALSSMFGKTQDAVRAVSVRVDTAAAELATAERALTEAQNDRSSVADQLVKDQAGLDAAAKALANRRAALATLTANLTVAETLLRAKLPAVYASDYNVTNAQNGWGPFERDRSNGETSPTDGKTIMLRGVSYAKGLGVHANSSLDFAAAGQFSRFESVIGIDDETKGAGSAIFQVWGDGKKLYESPVLTGKSAPLPISVDLTGVQKVQLVALNAGDSTSDHVDYANARFLYADNGAQRVVAASDLNFVRSTNAVGPVERDKTNGDKGTGDGRVMAVRGTQYPRGIGVSGNSSVTINTAGQYARFESVVGIDDETKGNSSAVFQVWGDGKKLYQSPVLTGKSAPLSVSVDLTGIQNVELRTVSTSSVHGDWANARFTFKDNGVGAQRVAIADLRNQIASTQTAIDTDTSVPAAQSALAATQQKLTQADLLVAQRSEAVASARQTYAGVQSDRGTLEREYSLLSAKVAAIPSTGVRLEREVQEGLLSVGREWNFTVEKPAVENLQSLFRDLAAEQLWAAEHERLQEERVFTLSSLFTPKAGSTTIPTGSSAVLPGGSGTVVTVRELNTELISLADGYLGAGGSTKWPEVYVDFSQPAYVESFDLLRVAGSRPAEIRITNLDGSIERISSNGGSTIIEKVVQAVSWDRMVSENVFHVNVTFKTSPEIEEANRLMTLKSALEAQDAEIAEQLRILQLRDALSVSDRREAAFALDVFPKDSPQWKAAAAALDHSRPETMQNSPEMHVVGVEGNRIVFEVFGSPGETYAVEQRYQGSGGTWVTGESKNVAMPSGQSSSLVSFYVTSAVQATSLSFCLSNAKTGIVPGSTATFGWNAVSRQLSITQESFPSLALRAGESAGSINDIQVDLLKACTKELLQQEAPAYSPIVFNYGTNIQASKDIIFNGQGISCDVNQIALWQLQQGNPDKWGTVGTDWIQAARAYCARNHTNEGDEIRGMQYDLSWQANKVMKDYNLLVQCVTDYFYSLLEGKLGNGVTAYDTRALNIGGQFFPGTQAIVAAMETNFRSIYGKLKAFEGEEVMELAARDRASEAAGTAQRIEENARHALDLAVQYMQSNPDSLGTPLSTRISTLTGNLDPAIMQKVTDEMKAGTYVGGLTPAQQQMVVQGFVAFYGGSTPSGNVAATPLDTRVIAHGELNDRFLATIMSDTAVSPSVQNAVGNGESVDLRSNETYDTARSPIRVELRQNESAYVRFTVKDEASLSASMSALPAGMTWMLVRKNPQTSVYEPIQQLTGAPRSTISLSKILPAGEYALAMTAGQAMSVGGILYGGENALSSFGLDLKLTRLEREYKAEQILALYSPTLSIHNIASAERKTLETTAAGRMFLSACSLLEQKKPIDVIADWIVAATGIKQESVLLALTCSTDPAAQIEGLRSLLNKDPSLASAFTTTATTEGMVMTSADLINPSTLRVRFNYASPNFTFDRGNVYAITPRGVQVPGQLVPGDFRSSLYVDIPLDSIRSALITAYPAEAASLDAVSLTFKVALWKQAGDSAGLQGNNTTLQPLTLDLSTLKFSPEAIVGTDAWSKLTAAQQETIRQSLDFGFVSGKNAQLISWLVDTFLKFDSTEEHRMTAQENAKIGLGWVGTAYPKNDDETTAIDESDLGECKYWVQKLVIEPALGILIPNNNVPKNADGTSDYTKQYMWENLKNVQQVVPTNFDLDFQSAFQNYSIEAGDIIQVSGDNWHGQHTMIIGKIENDGIWVFDSNYQEKTPMYHRISFSKLDENTGFTIYRVNS